MLDHPSIGHTFGARRVSDAFSEQMDSKLAIAVADRMRHVKVELLKRLVVGHLGHLQVIDDLLHRQNDTRNQTLIQISFVTVCNR